MINSNQYICCPQSSHWLFSFPCHSCLVCIASLHSISQILTSFNVSDKDRSLQDYNMWKLPQSVFRPVGCRRTNLSGVVFFWSIIPVFLALKMRFFMWNLVQQTHRSIIKNYFGHLIWSQMAVNKDKRVIHSRGSRKYSTLRSKAVLVPVLPLLVNFPLAALCWLWPLSWKWWTLLFH